MSIRNPIVIDDDSTDEEMVSSPTSTAPRVDMALDTSIEEEDEEGEVEQVVQDTLAERMALEAECFSLISRITAIERAQDDSVSASAKSLVNVSVDLARTALLHAMNRGASVNSKGCIILRQPSNEYASVEICDPVSGQMVLHRAHRVAVLAWGTNEERELLLKHNYQASHLCHTKACVWHVKAERVNENIKRNFCVSWGKCQCGLVPPCIISESEEQQARTRSFLEEHGLTLAGMEVLTPALSMPQAEAAVQASLPPSLALPLPKELAQALALTQSQPPSGEPAVKGTSAESAKQTQDSANKKQRSDTASNKVSLKQSKLNFKKL